MKKNVIYFAAMMLTWGFISCSEDIASEIDETMKDTSKVVSTKSLINESTNPEHLLGRWELKNCFYGDVDHVKDTAKTIFPVRTYDFVIDELYDTKTIAICVYVSTSKKNVFEKWACNNKILSFYLHEKDPYPYTNGYYNSLNCTFTNNTMTIIRKLPVHDKQDFYEYKLVYVKKTDY